MGYTNETTNFGFPYMADGDTMQEAQEAAFHESLDGVLQGIVDAVGVGVIEGGAGSIVGLELVISALKAIVPDGTGGVYVEAGASTYGAGEFAEGDNYVHCQLTATSRADRSCAYLISVDPTPPADAIALVRLTVAGGVITAVDNTVKAVPAIAARIPWEVLIRSYDDSTTLLEFLTAVLGAVYLGEAAPADINARLEALEAGGGGGGGGTVFWGILVKAVDDSTTIAQAIAAAIAQHVVDVQHGGGGGEGTAIEVPWDVGAANDIRSRLCQVRSHSPDVVATQLNSIYYVPLVFGDGTAGTPNFRDDVNSTW